MTGGRNKGRPGVFGRKKGHLRKHDLRKVCPVKGGGGGSERRKGIFGRLPVGGKGAPKGELAVGEDETGEGIPAPKKLGPKDR